MHVKQKHRQIARHNILILAKDTCVFSFEEALPVVDEVDTVIF